VDETHLLYRAPSGQMHTINGKAAVRLEPVLGRSVEYCTFLINAFRRWFCNSQTRMPPVTAPNMPPLTAFASTKLKPGIPPAIVAAILPIMAAIIHVFALSNCFRRTSHCSKPNIKPIAALPKIAAQRSIVICPTIALVIVPRGLPIAEPRCPS
jgi:hypothetical protein